MYEIDEVWYNETNEPICPECNATVFYSKYLSYKDSRWYAKCIECDKLTLIE